MFRVILVVAAMLIGVLPTSAQEKSDSRALNPERGGTLAAVRALANTPGPVTSEPDRQNDRSTVGRVRDLAGSSNDVKEEPAEPAEPREPKPKARKDAQQNAAREADKKPAAEPAKRQVQRRPQNDIARQQGGLGLQPPIGDRQLGGWGNAGWGNAGWGNAGWGNAGWGNGYSSNQIIGYRSYRYSGYGNGYGWPYYSSGYGYGYGYGFGYGFSPVMPTISGPVTIRYADPVGRQHKMMDDSIRKFAEDPTGTRR